MLPSRSLVNASCVPVGAQLGSYSFDEDLLVRLVGLAPVALIVKISELPVRSVWKAIFWLSGEKAGRRSLLGSLVRLVWLAPVALIVKMSWLPLLALSKAIVWPSREKPGLNSLAEGLLERLVCPVPSDFMV